MLSPWGWARFAPNASYMIDVQCLTECCTCERVKLDTHQEKSGNLMSGIVDIETLIAEIQQQLDTGQTIDLEGILQQFPMHGDRLKEFLAAQVPDADSFELNETILVDVPAKIGGAKDCPSPTAHTVRHGQNSNVRADDLIPLGEFGEYDLIERIALGGMGVVFKAHQRSLERIVALKSIRNGRHTTAEEIKRFRHEAQAAADLHHSNIVPIYDYGEVGGQHYFTMEYVEGKSLEDMIYEHPLPARAAVEYVRTVARTVNYAHSQGVVHRDLKPSNILIADNNQPRITDFGVARTVGGEMQIGGRDNIVGTPEYMSPEQSLGGDAASLPPTDIYSLGALLYALLTGRPPFQTESLMDTLVQVRTKRPVSPRLLNHKIPLDVETICLKCLRKEAEKRYTTAADLADDLDRFLEGKPIVARPVSRGEKLARMCRRNPAIALLSVGGMALTLTLISAQMFANSKLNHVNEKLNQTVGALDRSRDRLRGALKSANESRINGERLLYLADIREAGRAWNNGDKRQMLLSLERQRPGEGQDDFRGTEWGFLWNHARIASRAVARNEQALYFVCYSPDGEAITTAGEDAVIRIYNAATFREEFAIKTGQGEVNGLAYSPDGTILASAGDNGTISLWRLNAASGGVDRIQQIVAHEFQVYNIAFTPDGRKLVSTGRDPSIRIWDVKTGQSLGTLTGHERSAGSIAMSSDGRVLVSASHDGTIVLWDIESQSMIRQADPRIGRLTSVGLSPDDSLLVISSIERTIQVMTVPSLEVTHEFKHMDGVQRSLFTPDGTAVVAADLGGVIRIWPLSDNRAMQGTSIGIPNLRTWKAHRDRIYAMAISPHGDKMLSVGSDGRLLESVIGSDSPNWMLQKDEGSIVAMEFTAQGSRLVTIDGRHVEVWNPEDGSLLRRLEQPDDGLKSVATCSTGATLAVGGNYGVIHIWRDQFDEAKTTMHIGDKFNVDELALSPNGEYLAAVERTDTEGDDLRVFDLHTGQRLATIKAANSNAVAFSHDGKWLFASGSSNVVQIWHLPDGRNVVGRTGHVSSINGIQFSQNGQWAATCSDDRLVKVWQVPTLDEHVTMPGHLREVQSVAFAPDSRTLTSAGDDGRLKFWNLPSGQMLFELDMRPGSPREVEFSPDGRFLAYRIGGSGPPNHRDGVHILAWQGDEEERLSASGLSP